MSEVAPPKTTMKSLNERLTAAEDKVKHLEDHMRQVELESTPAKDWQSIFAEQFTELRRVIIQSLYAARSQGAWNNAKALEEKYFKGEDQQDTGDVVTTNLISAGGKG